MAVVFEGFSIREYASRMRNIDVVKCWPFGGVAAAASSSSSSSASASNDDDSGGDNGDGNSKIEKETMESLLPPIRVTKFRWWAEELDRLKSTELANVQSSSMEKERHKFQETQPRIQSDLLQVNLHVEEKSDERLDMLECPVCGAFAASTVNALNAHVDSCLAQASREERRQMRMAVKATKSRTPKKRSIVEIFAAAPQIHKVDDAADDDYLLEEDERGSLKNELNCRLKKKKKMKKKKKKVAVVKKLFENTIVKKLMKKKKKLKKNKNMKKDGLIANKENGSKLKLQTPVNVNRKPSNSLCSRGSNSVSIPRKKSSFKCLSAKKKNKVVQASKAVVEHEKPISPVRGILKNPTKVVSTQNAAMCTVRATTLANTCGVQHSVRHVSFSGKDDILGPHKKCASTFEKRICHVDMDPVGLSKKGHWIEGDKEFPTREINGSDEEEVSFSTENGIRVQTMIEKQQLPDIHQNADIPIFLRPPIIEQERASHFSDKSFPPGQDVLYSSKHMSNQGNQTAFHGPSYAGVPRHFSALKEIQNPFANSQVCGGVSTSSTCSSLFIDYFGDHTQEASAITSRANPRASLLPSSSGFASSKNASDSAPFISQFTPENVSGHASAHQAFHHFSPVELIGRLYPLPEWKQNTVAFREKYRDEEIFGLPLNSQGELVQAKSSGKGGFNQLKTLTPASGSSNSINNLVLPRGVDDHLIMKGKNFTESAFPNSQLSLFPSQNQMKENPIVNSPARLGATEMHKPGKDVYCLNSDRECNHSSLMDSDINLTNITFTGCRQYDIFQNLKEKEITRAGANADRMLPDSPPPTMRLMGKDVTIFRSNDERQGFADEKVWTDKEIIREHLPQGTALHSSYVDRRFQQDWILNPASGKFKEAPVQRFEKAANQAFPGNLPMKPLEPNFFQPGLNWQANPEFHNSSLRNPNPSSHHFVHPSTSHSIFDSGADFHDPFIPRNESLRVSSQLPSASTSHRIYQNIHGSSVELKFNQNLPNAVKSSFNFPFLHPDHGEHVQPSWFRESSKGLIPWLLQATQQGKDSCAASQPFPHVGGRCYPHGTQNSFLANTLVPHLPIVSYDRNPMITNSHMESPVGHPSIAHSLVPAVPGIKPTSVKDRMKLKSVGIQDPDISQKTRKRPRAKEDYPFIKPIKMPNLGILHESRAAIPLTRENFIDDVQRNMGSLEIEPYRAETGLVGWIPNESQCNVFGASAGIESSKVDGVARHGPIKLSAGVKHILKPSQNVDQDSRLIHSTIPFASVNDCGSILETQKKSTKIYRF